MNLRIVKREGQGEDKTRVLFLLPSEGEATAEDLAMLQALYSRDPRPIDDALKMVKLSKSGEFMNKFYLGYGHASVAELGSVVIAIENIPMPIAKLFQHYQLYRGQECSTRYLDFSKQPFMAVTPEGAAYQSELREFYLSALEPTYQHVVMRHALDVNNKAEVKAGRAATFDILRGFLPTGAVTNIAWCTDLRKLNERVNALWAYVNVFPGLADVLEKLESLSLEIFANSFTVSRSTLAPDFLLPEDVPSYQVYFSELMSTYGRRRGFLEVSTQLDYGSWRDIARHRSVEQAFPFLEASEYELWYVNQLPPQLMETACNLLDKAQDIDDVYAVPMAYKVPVYMSGHLDSFQYIFNIRTSQTVHPTLRKCLLRVITTLSSEFGLDVDIPSENKDPDWIISSKRGMQDIVKR